LAGKNLSLKIATIVGARPQFVKAAVVSAALRGLPGIEEIIIHTGQHYDWELSGVFFQELGLPEPTHHLEAGSASHGAQTGRMLAGIEELLLRERPDRVLVYGDTNSTLAGALSAAKLGLPIAHVEGGMRSFNRAMPEEINRVVTDHLADLHLCVNHNAAANLAHEGITCGVHVVGDVMYDACLAFASLAEQKTQVLRDFGLGESGYLLLTCHRQENTDDPTRLAGIMRAVERLSHTLPVLFPAHPRTVKALQTNGLRLGPRVRVLQPTGYLESLLLQRRASLVLTDSGGMQKEAFFHGVPCVTLRQETEWIETVECGFNCLAGADEQAIVDAALRALDGRPAANPASELYGQGQAALRIATLLAHGPGAF
jgi:UDP-GlcNAc3NAcA epimerase